MKKTVFVALAFLGFPALAQEPPKKIDVSKLPKETRLVEDVVVPVPSEVFAVLDKLGRPNWVAVQRPVKGVAKPFGERPQQAFYLGTVIAEGFIAVEATDKEEVKNIGNSVLSLSEALGVRQAVVRRANAIINAANGEDWAGVKRELDGAVSEVKDALFQLKSPELAHMVSLGGWVRGTEALCEVVNRDYSKDGAELLHQPMLIDYFEGKLKGLPKRFKSHPLVTQSQTALKRIRPLIGNESGAEIAHDAVKQIRETTAALVKAIQTQTK
jgi:hypothetical protein